jgi:aryl-alcohol dehydrogenase-like predicted oxidoreductase
MHQITIHGRPMSKAALGTMTFGESVDEAGAAAMVDLYLSTGGTMIDTANGYAGGKSEELLGRILSPVRDSVVLATKVGIPNPDALGAAPLSAVGIQRCVAASLRRLATDRVDVLYLHQPDRSTAPAETVDAVRSLIERGLVGAWGVSNFAAWQVAELRRLAGDAGLGDPVIGQYVYSVIATRLDDEYAEYAATTGLPTIVYNPLGGGLLTGKHRPDETPGDGRFGSSALAAMYKARYWNDDVFRAVDALTAIAADAGLPTAELALRWVLARPAVDAVLLGGSRLENIRANLEAVERGPLPPDLQGEVDAVSAGLRGVMPAYNR